MFLRELCRKYCEDLQGVETYSMVGVNNGSEQHSSFGERLKACLKTFLEHLHAFHFLVIHRLYCETDC